MNVLLPVTLQEHLQVSRIYFINPIAQGTISLLVSTPLVDFVRIPYVEFHCLPHHPISDHSLQPYDLHTLS